MIGKVRAARVSTLLVFLGLFCVPRESLAQKYKLEDPVPPGAQAKVLAVQGKVLELTGLASGVAGKAEALGAALRDLGAKTSEMEIRIELSSDVLFDFDKDELRPAAAPALEKVATVLKSYPNASCSIEGHTDSKGTRQYNQRLSDRRAESVKNWLLAHGVTTAMATQGWAETKPVAPNTHPGGRDNPDGRQKNRRVEIVVKKQ